jgi:predicted ester cyclase
MSAENKALIRQFLEAVSGKDKTAAILTEYITDEEMVQHIAGFESAFPRYEITAEDMIAEGDKVAVRARVQGTHKGDLMGIAPTGKQVSLPVLVIYRIADGKIAQYWLSVNQLELMQQLGVAPSMG